MSKDDAAVLPRVCTDRHWHELSRQCGNCGKKISQKDNACSSCGKKVLKVDFN